MDKYSFLFPFEKIKYGSRVIIYGAGEVGCGYLQQILTTNYCTCVAMLDRNAETIAPLVVPVYTPDCLSKFEYDYIILAFKDGCHVQSATDTLIHFGADKSQIIYQPMRPNVNILASAGEETAEYSYAFLSAGVSIAIKIGPSLGDSIIKKKIFMELAHMSPGCKIDLYASGSSNYMGAIYDSYTPGLNAIIDDGGILFDHNMDKYDVSIELYSLLAVKYISEDLKEKDKVLYDKMQDLDAAMKKYNLFSFPINNIYNHFHRMAYLGLDTYNYLNFTGVFDIKDRNVNIRLNEAYINQYKQYNLGQYVTINYGTGFASVHGKNVIAKQWAFDKLCQFVKMFKHKYSNIKVVQLGTKTTPKVPDADEYFLGQNMELVKYILAGSMLHIDSEGGLVHLASQLDTKCIVLFGPTMEEYFGYKENDNIRVGNCGGCYILYDEVDKCARGLECPECMNSITPELVMEHVDSYFSEKEITGDK